MATIVQINADTWRFEDGFVRFFLLVGEERAVMIDSGVSCPDAAALARTLTDKPITLLNTHADGDHTSGTDGFREIRIHASDYFGCGLKDRFPDTVLVKIEDGDVIDLGNRPLKVIHIPGHTEGSVAILDEKCRALYAGDTVQNGNIYMFGKHRCPEALEVSLEKLIEMSGQYDCIYASHGDYLLPGDYVSKVKAAWMQVQNNEIAFEVVDLHGFNVKLYSADACGFYVE